MTLPLPISRCLLRLGAIVLACMPLAGAAADNRPVEWVLGYAAGGGSDAVARILAEEMGKSLGTTIVVNNKPGASTNIAAEYAAHSSDPGNVIFTADFATLAANPWLFPRLGYDATRDFRPIGLIARFPLVLVVGPGVPVQDFKGFLAWARAQSQGANYASPGIGSPHHLATEMLRQRTRLPLTHVPYRGAGPALQDVMGGRVPFMLVDTAAGYPHIAGGKLKPIGAASLRRLKTMEEIPTLAEQGLTDFQAHAWQGLVAPAGAPPERVAQSAQALQAALASTTVKARLQALGVEPLPGTPQQMTTYVRIERERWGRVIREGGIKIE